MLSAYKPLLDKRIDSLVKRLSFINPNHITMLGIIPPILFWITMQNGMYWLALCALVASVIDGLDGAVARRSGRVTAFGGVLDSTIDRFADTLYIGAFFTVPEIPYELVLLTILAAYLTSYIRSRGGLALGSDKPLAVGIIERSERLVFVGCAVLSAIFFQSVIFLGFSVAEWILITLLCLSLLTVIQRLTVVYKHEN